MGAVRKIRTDVFVWDKAQANESIAKSNSVDMQQRTHYRARPEPAVDRDQSVCRYEALTESQPGLAKANGRGGFATGCRGAK